MTNKMAKNHPTTLVFITVFFLQLLLVKCQQPPLVPALYVFGDSLSDSGNNNNLKTIAKANHKPYGLDFPSGVTGRFSNGRNSVDFFAESLGLPLVPPYQNLSNDIPMTGVNYASGAAGILPESGTHLGENINFDKQINLFEETLRNKIKIPPAELPSHLSKSIFVITIGCNDYINNYLEPTKYQSRQKYNQEQFADLLINGLTKNIKKLYDLGARKFVVFNVGRIGCLPAILKNANPKTDAPCLEDVNTIVMVYNIKLPIAITELERTLIGSTFVRGDIYLTKKSSREAGFTSQQIPCCQVDDNGMCIETAPPCPDRLKSIYFDAFHPTEIVNGQLAKGCFNGSFLCTPINIAQLAAKS